MYVLITPNKIKMLITEKENRSIQQAIVNNDKAVFIQGATISLNITPEIYPFENWYAQENQRLALTHHRLCKKCLSIMSMDDGCTCWEKLKGEDKNAFKELVLPEAVKVAIGKIAKSKFFPELTDEDKDQISKENKPKRLCSSVEEADFYINPETGEKIYS